MERKMCPYIKREKKINSLGCGAQPKQQQENVRMKILPAYFVL